MAMYRVFLLLVLACAAFLAACGSESPATCDPSLYDCTPVDPPPCEGKSCTDVEPPCEGKDCAIVEPPPPLGPTFEWGTPGVDYPTKQEMAAAGLIFPTDELWTEIIQYDVNESYLTAPPEAAIGDTEYQQFLAAQAYIADKFFGGCGIVDIAGFEWLRTEYLEHYGCTIEKVRTGKEFFEKIEDPEIPRPDYFKPDMFMNRWTEDFEVNFPKLVEQEFFCQIGVVYREPVHPQSMYRSGLFNLREKGSTMWQWRADGTLVMHPNPPGKKHPYYRPNDQYDSTLYNWICVQTPYGAAWYETDLSPYDLELDADFTAPAEHFPRRATCDRNVDWLAITQGNNESFVVAPQNTRWMYSAYYGNQPAVPMGYTRGTLEDAYNPVSECEPWEEGWRER